MINYEYPLMNLRKKKNRHYIITDKKCKKEG